MQLSPTLVNKVSVVWPILHCRSLAFSNCSRNTKKSITSGISWYLQERKRTNEKLYFLASEALAERHMLYSTNFYLQWLNLFVYFIEKDPPVSLPVSGSKKESFRQHSVGRPTSYLMPTIFISSCSWMSQVIEYMKNLTVEKHCFTWTFI